MSDKEVRRKERMLQKFKEWTLGTCKNRTAKVLQQVRRLESIEIDGLVSCVTCDWRGDWRNCDAGHFVPRSRASTLLVEMNIHAQCVSCNQHASGRTSTYRAYMIETYGQEKLDWLEELSRTQKQFTKEELVELRIGYMDRSKALLANLAKE